MNIEDGIPPSESMLRVNVPRYERVNVKTCEGKLW